LRDLSREGSRERQIRYDFRNFTLERHDDDDDDDDDEDDEDDDDVSSRLIIERPRDSCRLAPAVSPMMSPSSSRPLLFVNSFYLRERSHFCGAESGAIRM